MKIELASRIRALPPYLFADIDRQKREKAIELKKSGSDLIDLGIGDPDLPTPAHIVAAMQKAAAEPRYHRYPSYEGMQGFRDAAVGWYKSRFGVSLDANKECCALIGSKEGIAHFPVAFCDPGDLVLVPDPGYPVYATWTRFVGGEVYPMPLRRENGFLPDLDAIPADVAKRAKMMWINYPNNPTAALASPDFYQRVVAFAQKNNIIVASDVAYSEIYFGKEAPRSFLEVPGAREVGIEFQSLSKTYNMTGWRIGWVCGNAEMIKGLATIKDSVDSGAFQAIQEAGIAALQDAASGKFVKDMRVLYKRRRDLFVNAMTKAGWTMAKPSATFYVWARTPKGFTSSETSGKLLEDVGVVCTPGVGFGPSGEGYVRFALSVEEKRMMEAVERIRKVKWTT